jgi:uncharacterized protein
MKRIIDSYLLQWKVGPDRMPLLIQGARQIGKTYAVRQLGKTYASFVEINLEKLVEAHKAFAGNLDPVEMVILLSSITHKSIIPGKTLLFIDEIQAFPRAIIALRYFYEEMPELHVIAAGSLLGFAIEQVGIPVGRVEAIEMYPLSFIEYLAAMDRTMVIQAILQHGPDKSIGQPMHDIYFNEFARYCAIGGMPKVVQHWIDHKDPVSIQRIHATILNMYRKDFEKYARVHQIKYVEKIFDQIPAQLGQKFKYSIVEGDFRKRELAPALDLLVRACIAEKVYYSAGQGTPLAGQKDELDYKVLFLDIGLAQTNLGASPAQWFLRPEQELVNKGQIIEALVGQEIAVYSDPYRIKGSYYWHKDSSPQAEIDYLSRLDYQVIPVEVKSGKGNTLKSLHYFLEHHKQSPYGIKFSTQDYTTLHDSTTGHIIYSYPLYAIARVISDSNPEMKGAIQALID